MLRKIPTYLQCNRRRTWVPSGRAAYGKPSRCACRWVPLRLRRSQGLPPSASRSDGGPACGSADLSSARRGCWARRQSQAFFPRPSLGKFRLEKQSISKFNGPLSFFCTRSTQVNFKAAQGNRTPTSSMAN